MFCVYTSITIAQVVHSTINKRKECASPDVAAIASAPSVKRFKPVQQNISARHSTVAVQYII